MSNIVCFGEVLWDVFPNHEKIGGAPLNVAYRLRSFENQVSIISAIGNDDYGKKLISYLKENNINTNCIQVLEDYSTGKVKVNLDQKGSATYTIEHPSAWDKIGIQETAKSVVKNTNAFIFGSLVARDSISRETLFELIDFAKYKVFDVNLRPPHYTIEVLKRLMNRANFIKFNDDELYEICQSLGSQYNGLEQNLKFIAKKTDTKHICVTKGRHGAVLLYDDKLYYNSGYIIKVVDTVGAGDSFLGSLISQILSQVEPQKAIDFACAVGALVAQSEGANPKISETEIKSFMNLD